MIRRTLLSLALIATPVAAQAPQPTPYDRAIAAGYKALTLCSAMFVAGRTQAQVEALELTGIYPEYDKIVPTLPTLVNRTLFRVSVGWSNSMPQRIAAFAPGKGCSIRPIGWQSGVHDEVAWGWPAWQPNADRQSWPSGDGGIAPGSSPAMTRAVFAAFTRTGPQTTGVIIMARDKIVAEHYAEGFGPFTANRTWSVGKSLAGTLVGVAVQQRRVRTSDLASIPEWGAVGSDPRRVITLDNLLHMSSGLHSATSGNRTDAVYFGGTAVTEETVAWPLEVKPGTRFRYANNDILLAVRSLRASLGDERYDAFPRELFATLGMNHTIAEQDWRGNYILSSQVWSTARDLARFGQLYLNDGVWNGERLLPEGWVKYVTTPSGPQPEGEFGYGATFWLMNRSPGVPADTYAAFGNRGQYVVIVPSRKVVIVRRGEDPTGARFDIAKFTAAVLATLP